MLNEPTQINKHIPNNYTVTQQGLSSHAYRTTKQPYIPTHIEEQDTQTLPVLPSLSFHDYLNRYKLLWHDIAQVAGVPALVVWSIDHGLIVSQTNARRVCSALRAMTGVPFTGSIAVMK